MSNQNERFRPALSGTSLYGPFSSQESLDEEYNVEKAVADFPGYIKYYQQASVRARNVLTNRQILKFGPTSAERLTIYPGVSAEAPVFLFVHGGYWRMGAAEDFDFIATGPLEAGFTVVVINYELAPKVTIPEIIRQVRASIAWTANNIKNFNGNAKQLFIGGHSAGAHLAAMSSLTNWSDYDLAADTVKGVLAVSGLYDLEPVSHSFIQPAIRISADQILYSSPIRLIKPSVVPITVSWGSLETRAFRLQSDNYLNTWRSAGNLGLSLIVEGADHFSILKEFETKNGLLTSALTGLLQNL